MTAAAPGASIAGKVAAAARGASVARGDIESALAFFDETGRTLAELVGELHRFPQKTINVRVSRNARALLQDADVQAARASVERKLGAHGRLVLRASGTEPLIRVTVEARDGALVESQATLLADVVRRAAAAAADVEAA